MAREIPRSPALVLAVVLGLALGIGGFTLVYAKSASYLTDNPATCVNCHVMESQHAAWLASSHHAAARCNDCHAPHDLVGKYATKASNGFRHALAFTTGRVPDAIQARSASREVTNRACQRCHERMIETIAVSHRASDRLDCVRCHAAVGHAG